MISIDDENIEWIDTKEALKMLRRSTIIKRRYTVNRTTLYAWIEKYNLGYKYAGRYSVDKDKFQYFIKLGNMDDYKKKT